MKYVKNIVSTSLLLLGSNTANASDAVEDLILLCKGNMSANEVVSIRGELTGKISKLITPTTSANGDLKYEGSISQYDILKLVKDGVSADTYKYDLKQYHLCIERMAPMLLNGVASINNQQINVKPSVSSNLLKVRVNTPINGYDTAITLQYARIEDNELVLALKIDNLEKRDRSAYLLKGNFSLTGEDTGEKIQKKWTMGLTREKEPRVQLQELNSALVKFGFELPKEKEALTFHSTWSNRNDGGFATTIKFTLSADLTSVSWLDVKGYSYEYSGPPSEQVWKN